MPIESRNWMMVPLTEDAIRAAHQPKGHFRVRCAKYPPGTRFSGSMRAGRCYVIRGACRYDFGDRVELTAGQFADLPEGGYELEVLGNEAVDLVLVRELPVEFRT